MNRIINFIASVFIVATFACNQNIAQRISYKISDKPSNVKIDSAFFNGATEPSICISPANPNIVVAGTILDRVYYSHDGGKNWTVDRINSSFGVYGDPVIRADQKGNFYYSHLSAPDRPWRDESFLDRIVIQKSTDGGISWSDGSHPAVRGSKDQDKQWLAVDPKTNYIYVSWTEFDKYGSKSPNHKSRILFSQSKDLGESWSEPKPISQIEGGCLDDDNTTEGAVPAAGVNGEIFVAWSHGEKIYFDRSLDQGESWLDNDIIIADQPGGWEFDIPGILRCNGMPITEVDHSHGPYRGTIYVNWSDQRNGEEDTDIWLSKSVDAGETWSAPLRVNNDPAGHQQFFCWMDVDPSTGYIYIVFYDRRDYLDNQTDVYLAYSTDGGQSFENKKISKSPFLPNKNIFFGDYNDISAVNGQIRPIWTRMDGGMLSSWTALIEMEKINE